MFKTLEITKHGNFRATFACEVPKFPEPDFPVWEKFDNGIHLARQGAFAHYFYSDGKPTHGYAGRDFRGTFLDGSTFHYKGAWSSRAGCVNETLVQGERGHIPVMDTLIVDVENAGYYDQNTAVLARPLIKALNAQGISPWLVRDRNDILIVTKEWIDKMRDPAYNRKIVPLQHF